MAVNAETTRDVFDPDIALGFGVLCATTGFCRVHEKAQGGLVIDVRAGSVNAQHRLPVRPS